MSYNPRALGAICPEMFAGDNWENVGNGTFDAAPATNAALSALNSQRGGYFQFNPNRHYHFKSQVSLNLTALANTYNNQPRIFGAGAILSTEGAISALQVTGNTVTMGAVIEDLFIDHDGNAAATGGIQLIGTRHTSLRGCTFIAGNGTSAGYKAVKLSNVNAADDSTGAFWTEINRCNFARFDGTVFDTGIYLEGAANSTLITGCKFSNATRGVVLTKQSTAHTLPANVILDNNFFEAVDTCVRILGEAAQEGPEGFQLKGSQIDSGVNFFLSYEGATVDPNTVPFVMGNTNSFGATHISNPNSLMYVLLEARNGSLGIANQLVNYDGLQLVTGNASSDALMLKLSGGFRGITLSNSAGVLKGRIVIDPYTGIAFGIDAGGNLLTLFNLPVLDPGVTHALWNNANTIKIDP